MTIGVGTRSRIDTSGTQASEEVGGGPGQIVRDRREPRQAGMWGARPVCFGGNVGNLPTAASASSERQQDIHHLLAVTRLLNIGDLAAAAIGDTGLGDLGRIDRVVGLDILRPHDAGDD